MYPIISTLSERKKIVIPALLKKAAGGWCFIVRVESIMMLRNITANLTHAMTC